MIELEYTLIIEATEDPEYFGFYSPDLEGFSGIGHSVEDCIYKAKWGMREHINLLKAQGLPIPPKNPSPKIIVQNEENWLLLEICHTVNKTDSISTVYGHFPYFLADYKNYNVTDSIIPADDCKVMR